jgi:hypothetical protein
MTTVVPIVAGSIAGRVQKSLYRREKLQRFKKNLDPDHKPDLDSPSGGDCGDPSLAIRMAARMHAATPPCSEASPDGLLASTGGVDLGRCIELATTTYRDQDIFATPTEEGSVRAGAPRSRLDYFRMVERREHANNKKSLDHDCSDTKTRR